jgi:maltose alpha-D-glucosyltransferase/alpha-amylase
LNWNERIIRMRKEVPEIGWGDFKVLDLGDKSIFAVRYDWRNNSVLTLPISRPSRVSWNLRRV